MLLFFGAFALVFLFINAVFLPLTSNPKFCGLACHTMEREYYTWQKSSHSRIPCVSCHVKQGLPAFFEEKLIEGPLGMAAEISGDYEKPINAKSELGFEKIPRETCERCHDLEKRVVTPSLIFNDKMVGKGFSKYHSKHLKRGITCTLCHNRITHQDVNEPKIVHASGYKDKKDITKVKYRNGLTMIEGCFRCHSPFEKDRNKELIEKYKAQDAPKKCTTCHPKKVLPIGHGEDWLQVHPNKARQVGFEFCWRCHGKGKRFQSLDKKRSRCRDCHHRMIGKQTLMEKNCAICHEEMSLERSKIVSLGTNAAFVLKDPKKAQYYRRMAYHKVHFPKKFDCTKCHLDDLETTKKPPFELCKNEGCHPPGQQTPPSGAKLCKQCHIAPHTNLR